MRALIPGILADGVMEKVAVQIEQLVFPRIKRGFAVLKPKAPATPLKALSPKYKERRKRLQKQGILASDTAPGKSNQTKTGDMLKSLSHSSTPTQAVVFFSDEDSQKKAGHQVASGRTTMNLSQTEYNKILKTIKDEIKQGIKKKGL